MLKFTLKLLFFALIFYSCTNKLEKKSKTELVKLTTQIDTIFQNYIAKNYINKGILKYYDNTAVDCNKVNKTLHKVLVDDQLARTESDLDMEAIDIKNQSIVISYFYECEGVFNVLDKKSKKAIFYTIQHSGDKDLMAYFYPFIKKSNFKNEYLALYVDRFLLINHKDQIFGSQVKFIDGKPTLFKIVDTTNLGKRRKIFGMLPIKTYLEYAKTH